MPITKTLNFLPTVFQSETNQKFLNATMDQLVTEPNLVPLNGYVGRKFAPASKNIDTYVKEPTKDRANYQLEPGVVVKDSIDGNVNFHVTYPEVLQKIRFYGGSTANQDTLWSSEYYSYDPHINLDAFINFGQYYWMPNGPNAVDAYASNVELEKTFYIYPDNGADVYRISGYGAISNPDLVLARGGNYQFKVNQSGKQFWIQSDPGTSGKQLANNNLSSRQVFGVSNNGTDSGTVTFNVPRRTAQDNFISMPIVQAVDFVCILKYSQVQNQLLSKFVQTYGGFDGINGVMNINNKYVIFPTPYYDDNDWTGGGLFDYTVSGFDQDAFDFGLTIPVAQRYGIYQIQCVPVTTDGNPDYVITLVYTSDIPVNNKVVVQSGIDYGNTSWYKNSDQMLGQVPIITANLDTLYYQDSTLPGQVGVIKLVDADNHTINVDVDILNKPNYISPNGVSFTNGLKIKFDSSVSPVYYKDKEFYVDGVGTAIRLTAVTDLIINFTTPASIFDPTTKFTGAATAKINSSYDQITISTVDTPSVAGVLYGTFPNDINPYYIVTDNETFEWPYRAGQNLQGEHVSAELRSGIIGMTLPGINLYGAFNDWVIPGLDGSTWHYNGPLVKINGADAYGGSVDAANKYYYRDSTFIQANAWGNVSGFTSGYAFADGHSKIIGFACDGYPIYGPYGYLNPSDNTSSVVLMKSSYSYNGGLANRPKNQTVTVTANVTNGSVITVASAFGVNPGMRVITNDSGIPLNSVWVINNGLQTAVGPIVNVAPNQIQLSSNVTVVEGDSISFEFEPGSFIEDYDYVPFSGSLDQYNGRFCVTPDFPLGTYAYFATQDITGTPTYPYFVGKSFYGSLEVNPNQSLVVPDYITINRSSRDLNAWSRRNRWFHKDVLAATSQYTQTPLILDQNYRATRPIIEFEPDLKLFNFGTKGLAPVDLYDTSITTPCVTVEGTVYVYLDGVFVTEGMRVIFAADQDPDTRNKIWVVTFVDEVGNLPSDTKVIHLVQAADGDVQANDTVSVFNGIHNAGKSFYYDGTQWQQGQIKDTENQPPKFDVFDSDGVSFGDQTKYPPSTTGQTFYGTKLFSYKTGTGINDPVLGFPLSYKNINNIGDIQFQNNYDSDTFRFTVDKVDYSQRVDTGCLHRINEDQTYTKLNVWNTVVADSRQPQIIPYIYDGLNDTFNFDIIPEVNTVLPNFQVYVNYKLLSPTNYQVFILPNNKRSLTITPTLIKNGDEIDIVIYSNQQSQMGYYEVPNNLNYNPQNTVAGTLTLGDMRNHITQLTHNTLLFAGTCPGNSNLRDLNVVSQGGTILQQSAPTTFASMFLCDEQKNFVNSILNAKQEFTRFKNKFLTLAAQSNQIDYSDPVSAVDIIIKQINQIKNSNFPWYYSDMVPYGDNKNVITYSVLDINQRSYEMSNVFTNKTLTNKAVLVYLNGAQLLYGIDYTFSLTRPAITLLSSVSINYTDTISIVEYQNTDGNWIPETPTKLGLYPKFEPEIYTDTTYLTPKQMLKGHDGSLTPTFGDFRDQMLLELEKRIYNNIKVEFNPKLINLYDSKPGYFRTTGISLADYNVIISRMYLLWASENKIDYVSNTTFVDDDAFSFNYGKALDKFAGAALQGSWRACYDYYYDTQAPHLRPWEMLGFSQEPSWWQERYGPAPYTSGNTILWTDLQEGYIAEGPRQGYDSNFARPNLLSCIPVNVNGELLPPIGVLTSRYDVDTFDDNWKVGQWSPAETAWRNSSEYAYAVQLIMALTKPARYFAMGSTTNKIFYDNQLDQYLVRDTNYRLTQADIDINGYVAADGTVSRSASYLNWISDYQTTLGIVSKEPLLYYVRDFTVQLMYRMASFSGKQYLKVLAEQNSPNSVNQSIIVPDEDYDVVVAKSTPMANPRYSAVIVERTGEGFKVSGYDINHPYFTLVVPAASGNSRTIKVVDQTVNYPAEFTNVKVTVPYDTVIPTNQLMTTFLAGYEQYLKTQGFIFDYYDQTLAQIRDWSLSVKEFLFWEQQGWSAGGTIVLSPVAERIKYNVSNAVVDKIENSYYGSKIMTQNFVVLESDSYSVVRNNNLFRAILDDSTGSLMGYIGFNLVQYEHLLIFNNKTQFNDVIYDPPSGQRQYRLKLMGWKTGGWTGALSAQGFVYSSGEVEQWVASTDYLKGDLVDYKNFYYTAKKDLPGTEMFNFQDWIPVDKTKIKTGLLPNFATNAGLGSTFYDTDVVNLEDKFDLYSLSLIGYRNRSYLTDLGVDDTSQVKFYQGFIKEKGTHNAINALANISFTDSSTSVNVNEEWAFRVGGYGSLETNQFVELVLNENYVLTNPVSMTVNSDDSVTYSSLYTSNDGLYKTAGTPWYPPFLLNRTNNSIRTDDIQTAGYVSLEDVDHTVFDLTKINKLDFDISKLGSGTTIWTAKNFRDTWAVYRVSETGASVNRVENALNNRLQISTDISHHLMPGDVAFINGADRFNGFYQVELVNSVTSFIVNYAGDLTGFSYQNIQSAPLYKLASSRFTYASQVKAATPLNGWAANSKVWIDSNSNNQWAVYTKSEPWSASMQLTTGNVVAQGNFGSTIKLSDDNNFAIVGQPGYASGVGAVVNYLIDQSNQLTEDVTITPKAANTLSFGSSLDTGSAISVVGAPSSDGGKGYAYVYSKDFLGQITTKQVLASNVAAGNYAYSVSISTDAQWLYVGAPGEDAVYVYGYSNSTSSWSQTVTCDGIATAYSLSQSTESTELLLVSEPATSKVFVPFVDFTASGTTLTFTQPPTGTLLVKQQPNFKYIAKLTGNTGSKFGFSVASSTNGAQVVVGAPYDTVNALTNAGSIKIYDRSIENFIAIAGQTLFGGRRVVTSVSKVYLDNVLQVQGVDYNVSTGVWVQFITPCSAGVVVTIETDQFNLVQSLYATVPIPDNYLGYSVDLCTYNCSVYAGAPYYSSPTKKYVGRVYRMLNQGRVYGIITGTVQNPTVAVGDSIRINDFEVIFTGTSLSSVITQINQANIPGVTAVNTNGYLTLSCSSTIVANKLRILPGAGTAIQDLGLVVFANVETIENPTNSEYDKFGLGVKINDTSDVLIVNSSEATTAESCTFDSGTTTFDAKSLTFTDYVPSGAVWIMTYLGDDRNNIAHPGNFNFVQQLTPGVLGNLATGIAFGAAVDVNKDVMLIGCTGYDQIAPNAGTVYEFTNPNTLKGWDIQLSETPKVDIDCLIKSYIYDVTDQTILYNLDHIDPAKGKILGVAEQDISYKTDYDPAVYNNLAANAQILSSSSTFHWNDTQVGQVWWDLSTVRYMDYEQGTIKYRTANWGRTFPGSSIDVYEWVESTYPPSKYQTNGGNGVPKYLNDTAYVTMPYVDPITNIPTIKYYFWVKDKTTVTVNQFGRSIPTVTIAEYIRNPKGSGIKFYAALRDDTLAVYNIVGDPTGNDLVMHLDYATQLNSNIIHSEYALLSEKNTRSTLIPQNIYNKLVDSVSGIDKFGNPVPDPTLAVQNRYGIDIRPRQGMFVDRNQAVKEMVAYVNSVFAKNVISQGYDLTLLTQGDPAPLPDTGAFDTSVPSYTVLGYIDIITRPVGYKVLVVNDETIDNLWTIYTKQSNNTWFLTQVQSYQTSDYWEYIDWYAEGFDPTVQPRYTVNTVADLTTLSLQPKDIVKILNNGSGKWLLVQVFVNAVITVGIESGTIALKDNLYNLEVYGMGFGNGNFDSQRFDQDPSIELRKILEALQDNIFINQLSQEFISLFFVFIYYVLNEQKYIDWAFKTSFINVLHKLRGLTQPPIYQKENQDYYRQYIEEVKPYHTTIREYVIDYQGSDNVNGYVSDFDVIAYYDQILRMYRSPSGEFIQDAQALQKIEYQDWLSSYTYHVETIDIIDGGTGYTLAPQVKITGSTIGNDARARAFISNGTVSRIEVTYQGSNYITQPTITIYGGNGTGARAYIQLSNNTTRKIKTTMVYDRMTYGSTVLEWTPNTTFYQGSIITHNNVAYLVRNTFTSGTTFVGNNLTIYPAGNFVIANDRIQAYYSPAVGEPGKDFTLLQEGIDYPGVIVDSPLYTDGGGFDVGGFDTTAFDAVMLDSDGSMVINDQLLDAKISSLYTDTQLGLRPEDIIVDGGAYVDTYSSHAPEELIPGRVYDTLDLTVSTLSTYGNSNAYSYWVTHNGFSVSSIAVVNGGLGYSSNVQVIVSGDTGYGATAQAHLYANGQISSITVTSTGSGFITVPNVTILGGNTSPARAAVRLTQSTYGTFDYRIFKDMNDNYDYLRILANATTTLSSNLSLTANSISVANSSLLYSPTVGSAIPGVIYVDGERITYWTNNHSTNTLSNIRRGTAGTGISTHIVGAAIVDGSVLEHVPYSDNYTWTPTVDTALQTTSTATFVFKSNTVYIRSNLWYNLGISSINPEISTESTVTTLANVISTESNADLITSQLTNSATDGNGLYASSKTQAIFIGSNPIQTAVVANVAPTYWFSIFGS